MPRRRAPETASRPQRRAVPASPPAPAPGQPSTRWAVETGHDLRQSLQAAAVQAHALARLAGQQGQPDWVTRAEAMGQALQHARHLLDDLLASLPEGRSARTADASTPAPDWQAIDLAGLLNALQQAWRPEADARGLWLRLQAPAQAPALPTRVMGDALWLRRVLDNLLANALAHTLQGGVTLAWQPADGPAGAGTVLTVMDTGTGLGRGAPPPAAGHGLGLLIVRRLCQQLGVSLALDVVPEGGTVARLSWPADGPVPAPGAAPGRG